MNYCVDLFINSQTLVPCLAQELLPTRHLQNSISIRCNDLGSSPSALTEELDRLPSLYRRLQSHGESRRVEQPQHQHLQGHHSVQHCTSHSSNTDSCIQGSNTPAFSWWRILNFKVQLFIPANYHEILRPRHLQPLLVNIMNRTPGQAWWKQTPPGTRAVIRANLPLQLYPNPAVKIENKYH